MQPEQFEQWAIVEIFGHQRIAGLVSEQTIGGNSFVRVDVPAVDEQPAFTKLYGQGAIYAVSFVDEAIATAAAARLRERPITLYEVPTLKTEWERERRALEDLRPAATGEDDDGDGDDISF